MCFAPQRRALFPHRNFQKRPEPDRSTSRYTLLKLQIVTGRTHQIRFHCSQIGHCLVGDCAYGAPQSDRDWAKRACLHSYKTKFMEPFSEKWYEVHRRRHRGESADERLDRLIAMEQRARSLPPDGREQHELRRLKAVPEGAEASGNGSTDSRRGQLEGGVERTGDVPRPAHLPLDLDAGREEPTGMLAPLFRDLSLGPRGDGGRALQPDPAYLGRLGEVRGHDQGGREQAVAGGTGASSNQVNPFWSPEVRREASALDGSRRHEVQQPRNLQPAMNAVDNSRLGISEDELERLKQKVMREAEENLKLEIRKLRGESGADSRSYHSASSGEPGMVVHNMDKGERPGGPTGPSVVKGHLWPFGDWLAFAGPQMSDIGVVAREWWIFVVHQVEVLYAKWLVASPVERLRLRPNECPLPAEYQRVEQRGVSMLLNACPDMVKKDLVATRTLSSIGNLFRLYSLFQPVGGAEKAALLKQTSEPKIGASVADLLTGLRQWRRLLGRAGELGLILPDPVVLSTVLGRMADALGKAGGGQVSYRISAIRPELLVDIRPVMQSVKDYSEVLQAEAEELALNSNSKFFLPPCSLSYPDGEGRGKDRYGLAGLDPLEKELVDGDTCLLLKQVALWKKSEQVRGGAGIPTGFLLETPQDPASYLPAEEGVNCPSFAEFPELRDLLKEPGMELVSMDQGRTGHQRRKPTSIFTNLPGMVELHELRGGGEVVTHPDLNEREDQDVKNVRGMVFGLGGCHQGGDPEVGDLGYGRW
eukprot:s2061_g18.t1